MWMWTSATRSSTDLAAVDSVLGMDREDTYGKAVMLALPLIATTLLTQGIQARFDPAPAVGLAYFVAPAPGQTIPLGPRFDRAMIAATLSEYRPFESTRVRGNETRQPKVRNLAYGAVGGFLSAMLLSGVSMLVDSPACPLAGDCGDGFWSRTGNIAVFTVPAGALIGFVTTTRRPESSRH
jgi:hypothetical protein